MINAGTARDIPIPRLQEQDSDLDSVPAGLAALSTPVEETGAAVKEQSVDAAFLQGIARIFGKSQDDVRKAGWSPEASQKLLQDLLTQMGKTNSNNNNNNHHHNRNNNSSNNHNNNLNNHNHNRNNNSSNNHNNNLNNHNNNNSNNHHNHNSDHSSNKHNNYNHHNNNHNKRPSGGTAW